MITVRRIQTGEAILYRQVRLAALGGSPAAFHSTYAGALERSEESWREQADENAASDDRALFLAFVDDAPVGLAGLYRDPEQADLGELCQVWVAPEHRGGGTAAALMDALFSWAGERGFRSILATIREGNDRALAFYRKYGFLPAGTDYSCEAGCILLTENVPAPETMTASNE